jgi:rubrerythrin
MGNMSYCRWENTYNDFKDCVASMYDNEKLSESERRAQKNLIALAKEFLENIDSGEYDEEILCDDCDRVMNEYSCNGEKNERVMQCPVCKATKTIALEEE